MPPGIYRLPLELVREVAAVSSSRDLAALSRTDRHFHAWVNPCLYEHNIKHERGDAAVWAAAHGRMDTLLLLHGAVSRPSKAFIKKVWSGRVQYGPLLDLPQPPGSPLKFTLLHLAAQGGHDDVVSWLLANGADVDACSTNLDGGDSWLGFEPPWTPLHLAIRYSQEKTVKLLLSHNATLRTNRVEVLHTAAARGLASTILHLSTLPGFNADVKDWTNMTPLHHAIMASKSPDVIKALLDVGADVQGGCDNVSPHRGIPLEYAFLQGDFEVAVMLLQGGAKPFSQNDKDRKKVAPFKRQLRRRQRQLGQSLLELTLRKESNTDSSERHGILQRKVMRALLDFGCDINEELIRFGERRSLLTLAVRHSSSANVRFLLERGAKVNAKPGGSSALYYAASERAPTSLTEKVNKITALVEHGADLLDDNVIWVLIILRNARVVMDAVADSLGPENLTDSHKIPRVLGICSIFQERKMYDSIKRYAPAQAQATDEDIRHALERAAHTKRACVPASLDEMHSILNEMRPGLTVDFLLNRWRGMMSHYLVEWLEALKGLEGSE